MNIFKKSWIAVLSAIVLLTCCMLMGAMFNCTAWAQPVAQADADQTANAEGNGDVTIEVVGQPALIRFTLGQQYDPEWLIVRATDASGSTLHFLERDSFTILAGTIAQEGDNEIAVSVSLNGRSYYTVMTLHGVSTYAAPAEAPVWMYYVIGASCVLVLGAVILGGTLGLKRKAIA